MSTFSFAPDYDADNDVKPKIDTVKFGDGYELRQARGLNIRPESWALTFSKLSSTDRDSIVAFFVALNGTSSFTWTPPGGSAGKYKLSDGWKVRVERGNLFTITAKFEQVFEP